MCKEWKLFKDSNEIENMEYVDKLEKVLEAFINKTQKECMKISVVDGEPGILDDKLGGKPYLPKGEEYPLDESGKPMCLVVQLNLKNVILEGWPKSGILEIFVDQELSWPCQYKIKYFEEGLEYQEELPEIDTKYSIVSTPVKINLEKCTAPMPLSEYRFYDTVEEVVKELYGVEFSKNLELDDFFEDNDWMEKFIENIKNPACTIGGYADFTQTDPRSTADIPKKECLFKLDSNLSFKNIHIGDSGILFAFITEEDLQNCKFENVEVDWDCC